MIYEAYESKQDFLVREIPEEYRDDFDVDAFFEDHMSLEELSGLYHTSYFESYRHFYGEIDEYYD